MRIYFSSMSIPNRSSLRVQQIFPSDKLESKTHMSIDDAQLIVANMVGYQSWYELLEVTESGSFAASPLDEVLDTQEHDRRILFQMNKLESFSHKFHDWSYSGIDLMKLVLRLQVTSSTGDNTSYYDYCHNRFHRIYRPHKSELFDLMRSQRTVDATAEIVAIENLNVSASEKVFLFRQALLKHPEDLNVVAYLLGLIYHYDLIIDPDELTRLHLLFRSIIPTNLVAIQKNWIEWGVNARDFILAMLSIGFLLARIGDYERGFRWLWVASNSCDIVSNSLEVGLKENDLLERYKSWASSVNEDITYIDLIG